MDREEYLKKLQALGEVEFAVEHDKRKNKAVVENESYPARLVRLYDRPGSCEDCGRICDNPPHRNLSYRGAGVWHERCCVCKFPRNPETGKFGPSPKQVQRAKGVDLTPEDPYQELIEDELSQIVVYEVKSNGQEPNQPQQSELQSEPTEPCPNEPVVVGYVEQVIVRECHESLIREFVKIPVILPPVQDDAQEPGSEVRKD